MGGKRSPERPKGCIHGLYRKMKRGVVMTERQAPRFSLILGEQASRLEIVQQDDARDTYQLAFGLEAMTPGPFRRDPPSALELEQAIMVVEDVLMPLAARIPPHETVVLHSPYPLAGELGSQELSRESVEQLFGQFAAMVEGDPLAAANLPKARHFAATLLILREWMHHLDARRVVLIDR